MYGRCNKNKCDKKCFEDNIKNYKFYLALENSVCEDYVTEKFFRFNDQLVPIVFRRKDYVQMGFNHSFVAVDEFK